MSNAPQLSVGPCNGCQYFDGCAYLNVLCRQWQLAAVGKAWDAALRVPALAARSPELWAQRLAAFTARRDAHRISGVPSADELRERIGDRVYTSLDEMADAAGVSRQTLAAMGRNDRDFALFVAQHRLSPELIEDEDVPS